MTNYYHGDSLMLDMPLNTRALDLLRQPGGPKDEPGHGAVTAPPLRYSQDHARERPQ